MKVCYGVIGIRKCILFLLVISIYIFPQNRIAVSPLETSNVNPKTKAAVHKFTIKKLRDTNYTLINAGKVFDDDSKDLKGKLAVLSEKHKINYCLFHSLRIGYTKKYRIMLYDIDKGKPLFNYQKNLQNIKNDLPPILSSVKTSLVDLFATPDLLFEEDSGAIALKDEWFINRSALAAKHNIFDNKKIRGRGWMIGGYATGAIFAVTTVVLMGILGFDFGDEMVLGIGATLAGFTVMNLAIGVAGHIKYKSIKANYVLKF